MAGESFKSKIGNAIESGKNRVESIKNDVVDSAKKAAESVKNSFESTKNTIVDSAKKVAESSKNAIVDSTKKVMPAAKKFAGKVAPIVGDAKKVAHEINAPTLEALLALEEKALKGLEGNDMTPKSNNTNNNTTTTNNNNNNNNNNNKQEDYKERKTSIMPIISKIVGGLLGGKWGAFGDEHSQLGQSIADAGRMAGYTQGELDMKDADNAYQKEFESYMAGLDIQKQKNITKAIADLYATDSNSKAYMDKQFELQKELQKQGFNQNLISQILGGAITIGLALAAKGLKSDSKTKLKYCLDK